MSLFDIQDVCIAIGSLTTLDLPMVVDLIGIYGLKEPYGTLTTTDWFLQALSVIPRGSWGDVARRFTMIRWADFTAAVSGCTVAACWSFLEEVPTGFIIARPSAESYEGKTLSYQLIQTTSFCNRQLQTPTAGCTATGYFLYDVASSLALLFTTADSFLLIVMSLLMSSMLTAPAELLAPTDLSPAEFTIPVPAGSSSLRNNHICWSELASA
ncbi:UGT protein [Dorcoceras hygrometricum]|uniref:UGT protein n=1 Tax=Dorcoceras hygrometricum TaxID=472368 RepID=A0A2Z7ADV3_9LAMI|nr:UGT protein [Dorcoceras hygrometricum]